jgi:hypothetical protein
MKFHSIVSRSRVVALNHGEHKISSESVYQVNLSVDGKHSVSVQSDDPAAVTEGLVWAKKTWGQLVRLPGKGVQTPTEEPVERIPQAVQSTPDDEHPPACAVHQLPMIRVQGKKGAFWSCHQKNEDGSWCSYKPPKIL